MVACHHRLKSILFLSSRCWSFNSPERDFFSIVSTRLLNGQGEGASKFEGSYSSRCRDRSVKSTDRAPCYASTIKLPSFSFTEGWERAEYSSLSLSLSGSDKRQGLFDWIILKFRSEWSVQDVGREFHSLFLAERPCLSPPFARKKRQSEWNWSARLCVTFIYRRK